MLDRLVIVRGAGDIATGTIHRLIKSGFPVIALECENPSAIRRRAAFSEAWYDGETAVEGVRCVRADSAAEAVRLAGEGIVGLITDPDGNSIRELRPFAVVDAILAKRNIGTNKDMAPVTVALGPGFCAGVDADYVIETMRGHDLGRVITSGFAMKNTGVPGPIDGHGADRVIHSPCAGILQNRARIGDIVKKGQVIAEIETADGITPVKAGLDGVLRGLIRGGYPVTEGFKTADIDPRRDQVSNCFTISDKARCIAGSVLECICAGMAERI